MPGVRSGSSGFFGIFPSLIWLLCKSNGERPGGDRDKNPRTLEELCVYVPIHMCMGIVSRRLYTNPYVCAYEVDAVLRTRCIGGAYEGVYKGCTDTASRQPWMFSGV